MKLHLERLPHSVELVLDGCGMAFRYIDERLLPGELRIAETRDWREVVSAVKSLAVRGAPAIGLAGASAVALWAQSSGGASLEEASQAIANARPTAVNLSWGVRRALDALDGVPREMMNKSPTLSRGGLWPPIAPGQEGGLRPPLEGKRIDRHFPSEEAAGVLFELVKQMEAEDERVNRAIGEHGAALLGAGSRVLTHCNAGSLGTCFFGTALGVVYAAAEQGRVERVYADETRPVGQGARLTAWELARVGVPVTLICDNMAASLMAQGGVDAVIVGADRITRNGDVANKIGTYGVAVLAHEHGIPFYVAAPSSTIDPTLADGSGIVIEQREAWEVLPEPIEGVDVWNPAFDVTPARYVSKIITETGAFPPGELESQL